MQNDKGIQGTALVINRAFINVAACHLFGLDIFVVALKRACRTMTDKESRFDIEMYFLSYSYPLFYVI